MEEQTVKVTIPFHPLLKQILTVLKFSDPVFYFLNETKNSVNVSVKAKTNPLSYVYVGGEAENIAASCEKASQRAVKDLIKKFDVYVEDITSTRQTMFEKCADLYNLKCRELERTEKGLAKDFESIPLPGECECPRSVCVEYMSILREVFKAVEIKCNPIETVEISPGTYVSWITLLPSEKVVKTECIFSDGSPDLVASKENLAKKVIFYLMPLYNLEIIDANYNISDDKYGEVMCAHERESYLTVKERVLGIKESVEPSVLLVEQDCITPKAAAYRTSAINCPPLPVKERISRVSGIGNSSGSAYQTSVPQFFSMPPELETVFKRTKRM